MVGTATDPATGGRDGVEGTPLTVGMVLWLASELMLFGGFFAAYFTLRAAADTWPPADVDLDVARDAVFTAVFAVSAFTVWRAAEAAKRDDGREVRAWLLATGFLGVVFVAASVVSLRDLPFGVDTDAYGSIYWILVVVHLLHVTVGLFLIGLVVAVNQGRTRTPLDSSVAVLAYFWWFLVALSIAVFVVLDLVR